MIGIPVCAQSLKGSPSAMREQNSIAQRESYTFLATGADVRRYVDQGYLVSVRGDANLKMADVSYPYARPAIKLFLQRLAPQYKDACGEKLTVTSLTRPMSRQPWNAHELSVHPAGMALDLRIPRRSSCRLWLENTLKSLEARHVLQATKERRPAHYHIAVYPDQYTTYVASLSAPRSAPKLASAAQPRSTGPKIAQADSRASYASILPVGAKVSEKGSASGYKVRPGDTLWSIARRFDVTIAEIKKANGLSRSVIKPGETLKIPSSNGALANAPAE
jgi:LysM repeat protein